MKKINSIIMSLFAVLAFASCVKEEVAVFNPEETKVQALGNIAGCTLTEDGDDLTVNFDSASFSVPTPVVYTFFMAPSGSENGSKLNSTIANGTITFKQKDLNSAILGMDLSYGVEVPLDFWLVASLGNDKGAEIAGTSYKSNVVTASFVAYNSDVNDVDRFEHIWVIGAGETIGGWDHGKVYQYLYDYNKDGKTYEGLIDYGENAAGGWKLTGIAGWDDSCNWGSPDQSEEPEAQSITLISAGSSKDIKCYSKRFYKWEFDKTSLVLKKVYGFDNVGLVGTINEWNQADPNMKMKYNAYKHRFYIDYTFEGESEEIKFTCDDAWTLNWGAEISGGEGNIKAPAGSYRIYLDLNAMEYKFDAKMFGQDEPGIPASGGDTPEESWSIIGLGNDWNTDHDMTEGDAGVWKYSALTLTETDEFKIRKDHGWATSVGGPEGNATSNIDATNNPYEVYKPELGTAFSTGDKNIAVQVAGTYDVVYDTNNGTITISDAVPAGAKPIHILMKSMGWETNNLYGWGLQNTMDWPGIPATGTTTLEGVEYVYWTLDKLNWGKEKVGLIFNNGSVQTVDITPVTLDGNKCYELGELADGKHTYTELPLPGIKVTYTNPEAWTAVSLYGWGDFGFGDWPGVAMTQNGDVFEYVISGEHFGESASIIFNTDGAQTADLGPYVFDKDATYDAPAK